MTDQRDRWDTMLDQQREQLAANLKARGIAWPPGMYQATWRGAHGTPEDWSFGGTGVEKYDGSLCMLAILDALLNQGSMPVWNGDGTSCVEQMIALAYQERDFLAADNERLRALLKEAVDCTENCCGCISQHGGDLKGCIDAILAAKGEK